MRFLLPGIRLRRSITKALERFFDTYEESYFLQALKQLCDFYGLPVPPVKWYERLNGDTLGETDARGRLYLIHPENWKQRRAVRSKRAWLATFLHEFNHLLYYVENERKADLFARKFLEGIKPRRRT